MAEILERASLRQIPKTEFSFARRPPAKLETSSNGAFRLERYKSPINKDSFRDDIVSYLGEYRFALPKYSYKLTFENGHLLDPNKKVSLEGLCKTSDIVSLHAAYSSQLDKFFGNKYFSRMKPSAYFINTARGELTDEKALLEALNKKRIKGAAIDVMINERGDGSHLKGNPLLAYARTHGNLLIVPHLGGATYEAMQITEDFIADLVVKYFSKN